MVFKECLTQLCLKYSFTSGLVQVLVNFEGSSIFKFKNYFKDILQFLAHTVYPDEMHRYATSDLGLQLLSVSLVKGR